MMTPQQNPQVNEELQDYIVETYGERFFSKFDEDEANWNKAILGNGRKIKPVYFVLMEREKRIVELESIMKKRLRGGDVDLIISAIKESQESKLAQENTELKKKVEKLAAVERMLGDIEYRAKATQIFINKEN